MSDFPISVNSYVRPIMSRNVSMESFILSGSYNLSSPFMISERRCLINIPFSTECSKIFYSLYIIKLWVSVYFHLLPKETSLMMSETLICGCSKILLEIILLLYSIEHSISPWFSSRPMAYPVSCSGLPSRAIHGYQLLE